MKPATVENMAHAIMLRGIFAGGGAVDVRFNEMQRDNFEELWENLPQETQAGWLTVAALVDKAARGGSWGGKLT